MTRYSGITADDARHLSLAAPATSRDTLELIETVIGCSAQQQLTSLARVLLAKSAHRHEAVEQALADLQARGFRATAFPNAEFFILEFTW